MSDVTGIAWTDHTFNPWWGCTRISPGCDNCYAATWDARFGGNHWDPHIAPRTMSVQNWNKPVRWNKDAEKEGRRHRVFSGSMCDVFDNKAPAGERDRLWDLIRRTPWLDWQLLTKRPGNIPKMLPADWGNGWPNVWLGTSICTQDEADTNIDMLRKVPACMRFLSVEPLLQLVDLGFWRWPSMGEITTPEERTEKVTTNRASAIHWVIVGGESGKGCRPMNEAWAQRVVLDCAAVNIPVFFKQMGGEDKDHGGDLLLGMKIQNFPVPRAV